jgi:hypothetical protein
MACRRHGPLAWTMGGLKGNSGGLTNSGGHPPLSPTCLKDCALTGNISYHAITMKGLCRRHFLLKPGGRLVHGTRAGYSLRVLLSTSATASPLIVISRRFSSGSWRLWLEVFADVAEADAEVLSALEELVGCPEGRCPTRPRGPEFNPKATKALQTIEHDPEDLVAHRHVAERHPTKRVEYPAGGVLGSACAQEVTHETLKGIVVALSVRFAQFPRALSTCSLPKSNFVEQLLDEVASLRRACPAEQCCVAIFADACSEDAE